MTMTGVGLLWPPELPNLLSQIRSAYPPGGTWRGTVWGALSGTKPLLCRDLSAGSLWSPVEDGRGEEAGGRPSSSGEPAPPAGRGGAWLPSAGRKRRGLACSSAPLPLCPSVLVICPWGGCHHRLHTAPRGAEDGPSPGQLPTPSFLGVPLMVSEADYTKETPRGSRPRGGAPPLCAGVPTRLPLQGHCPSRFLQHRGGGVGSAAFSAAPAGQEEQGRAPRALAETRDRPHCHMVTASLSASRADGRSLAGRAKASSCGLLGAGRAGEGRRRACGPSAGGLSCSQSGCRV